MIIITKPDIAPSAFDAILERIERAGLVAHVSRGTERIVIGCVGDERALEDVPLAALPGVDRVMPVLKPYRLASRETRAAPEATTEVVLGVESGADPCVVGGRSLAIIAGPCSVEGREMLHDTAGAVRGAGASALRGGAYKPRTSPYAFQGMGAPGLELLADVRASTGLPVVSEVMDPRQVESMAGVVDCLQVGARNMQNFALLAEVGTARVPVLLKRGLSATVHELLMAAEYVLSRGNPHVILCERGIRTFETATRNTLDVAAIPVLRAETHLPVLVDPSHAGGKAALVAPLAYAAIAAGADGLIVEVHPDPSAARSDGEQSLTFEQFRAMMVHLGAFAAAAGRTMGHVGAGSAARSGVVAGRGALGVALPARSGSRTGGGAAA